MTKENHNKMKQLLIERRIQQRRDQVERLSDEIDEFRYRQVKTQYQFEKKCQRYQQPVRQLIMSSFVSNANEIVEHGFFSHYRTYMHNDLERLGFKAEEVDNMILAYMFRQPIERECFLSHIISGSVERQPDLFHLRSKPQMRGYSMLDLGRVLMDYRAGLGSWRKTTNVLNSLEREKPEDKKDILGILQNALSVAKTGNTMGAVDQMTDQLTPYFFKEARPYLNRKTEVGKQLALYAGFYARREKFYRIQTWIRSFSWLFLTQHDFERYCVINSFINHRHKVKSKAGRVSLDTQHQR